MRAAALSACLLLCLIAFAAAQEPDTPAPAGTPAAGEEPAPEPEKGEPDAKGKDKDKDGKDKGKKDKPNKKSGGRELDPESEVGRKLAKKLVVDPRYATDGTVELIYTFNDPEELGDWTLSGFDRAEDARMGRRRLRAPAAPGGRKALDLGVASSGGLMRHTLSFVGDFELSITLKVDRSSGESDLVFFRGDGGLRWGAQLVRRSGDSFRALLGEPDRDPFAGGRVCTLRLVHEGGELHAFADGKERVQTDKLMDHLDGQVGLYARDMLFRVDRLEIHGKPDPKKLN